MRLLNFANLFHRRSKSDSALNTRTFPTPLPTSLSFQGRLSCPEHQPTSVLSEISATPISLPPPLTPSLNRRIRHLETALETQRKLASQIPILQNALTSERSTVAILEETITELQSDILHLRGELFVGLQRLPAVEARMQNLQAANAVLLAQQQRYVRFIRLMIDAGVHKPVLDRSLTRIHAGVEPEDALVEAVQHAMAKPGSAWCTLLQPVVGERSPMEYMAQVDNSIRARKDAREWRKRAKFWKRTAVDAGGDTITPSVSDISDIVDVLPVERQRAVDEMMKRLRNGTYPRRASEVVRPVPVVPSLLSRASLPALHSRRAGSIAGDLGEDTDADDDLIVATVVELPPSRASMVSLYMNTSTSAKPINLQPLASQAFRESYSIKSIGATSSRRHSLITLSSKTLSFKAVKRASFCLSLGDPSSSTYESKRSITSSDSVSTQASSTSNKSKRRRVNIVAVQTTVGVSDKSASESTVIPDAVASSTSSESCTSQSGSVVSVASAGPGFGFGLAGVSSPALPQTVPGPMSSISASESSSSSNSTPRASLVLDFPHVPLAPLFNGAPIDLLPLTGRPLSSIAEEATPTRPSHTAPTTAHTTPSKTTPGSGCNSASPSPNTKSRLPRPVLKTLRRLSISRPVLVDSTNYAAATGSPTKAKTSAIPIKTTPSPPMKAKARARCTEPENIPITAVPTTPTKGPKAAGRTRRRSLNFMGAAKKAVQGRRAS